MNIPHNNVLHIHKVILKGYFMVSLFNIYVARLNGLDL